MPRALTTIAYWVCVAAMGMVLAGCAETTYPSLPGLPSESERLLTPTQQEKAIKDIGGERVLTGETDKPR
jgi:hypothetical protein